jgi:hypothetical protein
MCDDVEIAYQDKKDHRILRLRSDIRIPDWLIPYEVFKDGKTCTVLDIMDWAEHRVFPRERIGKDILLLELGLDHYDPWAIAMKTRASTMDDWWWIKLDKKDTFRETTVRGKARFESIGSEIKQIK